MKKLFFICIFVCQIQLFYAGDDVISEQNIDFLSDAKEIKLEDKTTRDEEEGGDPGEKDVGNKNEEEKPKSPHTFTANVAIVSDYRFRGISQTMRRPAIQGGFDYSHEKGIYLGTWASNVDGTTDYYNNTSMEWDLYGGFKSKPFTCLLPDFQYNLGLIYYYYPGGKAKNVHNTRYNTAEYFIELSYKWLTLKYSQALTNYFGVCSENPPFNWNRSRSDKPNGSTRGTTYIEANVSYDLMDKGHFFCWEMGKLNLFGHVGNVSYRHYSQLNYIDWRVTLTQEMAWFNIFISYVDTDAKSAYYDVPDNGYHPHKRNLGGPCVLVGVIKNFN